MKEYQLKATAKYHKEHYKQVAIRWDIDFVEQLHAAYKKSGKSLAEYVKDAIKAQMALDATDDANKEA